MPRFHYQAYGLKVSSNLELCFEEEPWSGNGSEAADVIFDFTEDPWLPREHGWEIIRLIDSGGEELMRCLRMSDIILFEFIGASGFMLSLKSGRVQGWSERGKSQKLTSMFFSGNVLNLWLIELGIRVLHATAVVTPAGHAIAFVGPPGAGKSTMGAAAIAAGMPLLADDLVALKPGTLIANPGFPELKVHSALFNRCKLPHKLARPVAPEMTKIAVQPLKVHREPVRLSAVFFPEVSEGGRVAVEPLSAHDSARRMLGAPRLLGLREPKLLRHEMQTAFSVARSIPGFSLKVPTSDDLPVEAVELAQQVSERSGQ